MKELIESEKSSEEIIDELMESLDQSAVTEIIYTAGKFIDADLSPLAARNWSSRGALINQIVNDYMQNLPAKDTQEFVQAAGG